MNSSKDYLKKIQSGDTLVTGGAGFIGSHLVDKLISHNLQVKVIDNLSTGNISNLKGSADHKNFHFFKKDLSDVKSLKKILKDVKWVFHMAADPEVRTGFEHPEISFQENLQKTFHLLEEIRKTEVEGILFASTSTVYGEPLQIPTPENYGPLLPISPYGASKLACEALISSYCHSYGINGINFRFANIVGSRNNHGVISDFIGKLRKNKKKLEVLGDGKQSKSYLHVNDCVNSFFFCLSMAKNKTEVFNVGNEDSTNVLEIAKIVCKTMNLNEVEISPTGGVDNGRGWIGDVKLMHLDIQKIKKLGWKPQLSSKDSIKTASKEILKTYS